MKIVSLDIETTGLTPGLDQILEIAAIKADTKISSKLDDLEVFHRIIRYDNISGSPKALVMNQGLINDIAKGKGVSLDEAIDSLGDFLGQKAVIAGKNPLSFDLPFLNAEGLDKQHYHHRALDPTPFYIEPDDAVLPSLTECLNRIALEPTNLHSAVGDAYDILRLIWPQLC